MHLNLVQPIFKKNLTSAKCPFFAFSSTYAHALYVFLLSKTSINLEVFCVGLLDSFFFCILRGELCSYLLLKSYLFGFLIQFLITRQEIKIDFSLSPIFDQSSFVRCFCLVLHEYLVKALIKFLKKFFGTLVTHQDLILEGT